MGSLDLEGSLFGSVFGTAGWVRSLTQGKDSGLGCGCTECWARCSRLGPLCLEGYGYGYGQAGGRCHLRMQAALSSPFGNLSLELSFQVAVTCAMLLSPLAFLTGLVLEVIKELVQVIPCCAPIPHCP